MSTISDSWIVRKVWIRNFKSLRDVSIDLEKMNILIGPNGSGKSNIVEAFLLLKKIYSDSVTINPFLEWWGYDNVVWQKNERLPIVIGFEAINRGFQLVFETTITGIGGRFAFLKERIKIDNYAELIREGDVLTIRHNANVIKRNEAKIKKALKGIYEENLKFLKSFRSEIIDLKILENEYETLVKDQFKNLIEREFKLSITDLSLLNMAYEAANISIHGILFKYIFVPHAGRYSTIPMLVFPVREIQKKGINIKSTNIIETIKSIIEKMIVLKPISARTIKETIERPKAETFLKEDGSNVINILHNLTLMHQRIPQRVKVAIDLFIPNLELKFELTSDGRILLKGSLNKLELYPPMFPDGLYKMLVYLTAIELNPSILVIDEIENSLHPKAIEILIDELKNSNFVTIATTHSPAVIDIVDLKNIVLVEYDERNGTQVYRIENPDALRRKLEELGLTVSEGWLYGELRYSQKTDME